MGGLDLGQNAVCCEVRGLKDSKRREGMKVYRIRVGHFNMEQPWDSLDLWAKVLLLIQTARYCRS